VVGQAVDFGQLANSRVLLAGVVHVEQAAGFAVNLVVQAVQLPAFGQVAKISEHPLSKPVAEGALLRVADRALGGLAAEQGGAQLGFEEHVFDAGSIKFLLKFVGHEGKKCRRPVGCRPAWASYAGKDNETRPRPPGHNWLLSRHHHGPASAPGADGLSGILVFTFPLHPMSDTLKTVPLNDVHQQLGAKMVPFAGYNMPVRYSSDLDEHHTVRRAVGMFDVSHMGEFRVRGPQALDLIQRVTSNDASKLAPGKAQYSCLPNEQGGIVDDLLVYMLAEEDYLLVVNASNIDKDWAWIQQFNTAGAEMQNISDEMSLFAVQGPKATSALQSLTDADLSAIPYYSFLQGTFAGAPDVIISATGYTGAGGFELYVPNQYAKQVWDAVMTAGQPYGLKPIGLGARDTLRLEMGYCLYGNDITDTTSPLEAGLGWITKFTKDFTNSDSLKAQKEAGVERKLVGFLMDGPGIPRGHYPLVNEAGEPIGEVTSGTQSPSLGKGVGLGYVQTALSKPGSQIFVQVRGKNLPATVTKLPFVSGTEEV